MARRRSFLDSGEVDEVAARAGLIEGAPSRSTESARPVRFAYTGSSIVVAPTDADAAWATRTLVPDADPDANPRVLRLRATAPPEASALALLEWSASCADARAGALCDADGAVIATLQADDWPVGAWARLAGAARAIAEPREGLSFALPVVGGVLRVCFCGLQPESPALLLLTESDPGDAFGDELGSAIGRWLQSLGPESLSVPVRSAGTSDGPSTERIPVQRLPNESGFPATRGDDPQPGPTTEATPHGTDAAANEPAPDAEPATAAASEAVEPARAGQRHTRPEPVVEAGTDSVLADDLLLLIDASPTPRWARMRVAVRTRIPPSRLALGSGFTREERALLRYAVGRVLVMEVP